MYNIKAVETIIRRKNAREKTTRFSARCLFIPKGSEQKRKKMKKLGASRFMIST